MIRVIGPRDKIDTSDGIVINTTSRSNNWSSGLSPFFLGPVKLYKFFVSQNVENAWQFCKVYKEHLENGEILGDYWHWALKGWNDSKAHRYPMGKGAVPEFSLWDGKRLSYVEARIKIYVPLYSKTVRRTEAYKKLVKIAKEEQKDIYLWDFDGYDYISLGMSLGEVLFNSNLKMGHAFVLAKMLEKEIKCSSNSNA